MLRSIQKETILILGIGPTVAVELSSLENVQPKSLVPLGLLANTSQTRLTHNIRPLSRAMVSSATPVSIALTEL